MKLTPREQEVWELLETHTHGAIAAKLGISTRTVELHCARARHKVGIRKIVKLGAAKTYLISSANGMFKVGFSSDVKKRFNSIKTGSPVALTLIGVIHGDCEQSIIAELKDYWSHGEWFKDCDGSRAILCRHFKALK